MKFSWRVPGLVASVLIGGQAVSAIDLDLNSTDSIKQAASTAAYGLVKWYTGNNTGDVPGNLPAPYFWWEAGAMFGSLVDYWYYTGDDSYNEITTQALLFQTGPNDDYMPPNQTKTEGNDDQGFWAMAAMTAAEDNYPNPPSDKPQWLALAQAVFNTQATRWDDTTCGGGLRWQIFTFNNGYNYKNTISNGCFFNVAARLARYTGNQTYADWAEKIFDWVSALQLMDENYHFYDGSDDTINCTQVNHIQWTYNAGVYMQGAAAMWNLTQSDTWKQRVLGIINGTSVFFQDGVMYEVACEPNGKCDNDQRSFKAYLSRAMAATAKVAPFTFDLIMPLLQSSAQAAAQQCSGTAGPYGSFGNVCGLRWTQKQQYDGSFGPGEQMAAMEIFQSNLVTKVQGPVTNKTGGTSKGNPNAGSNSGTSPIVYSTISTSDRAGAGIITTLVLIGILGGALWMASA
ncbi:mannan endo-1,6-alpha-mannosidase [Rhizodiscina lignyota]|uniref:Mannan endo-1,6-alpha-mannosidase n=1 Tax=Rhizodiscina lignyota TaxID=1504668 RepID=A0A9P4M5H5_9PEZI|nr:mannan endo-1,6-alpha-mannosidase [Rhizodiscina lignyota]